jgi:gliding motility-associated-like protein
MLLNPGPDGAHGGPHVGKEPISFPVVNPKIDPKSCSMALRYTTIVFSAVLSLLLFSAFTNPTLPAHAADVMAPVFVDPTPGDLTVPCVDAVPAPVDLTANDGMGGADFEVSPVDTPDAASIDPCAGGIIVRSWTATVGMESTTVSQNITVLPDGSAPMVTLPVINDTVACEFALPSAPNNPDRYDVWISSLRVAVSTNASDNCAGPIMITDDSSNSFTEACATRIVTFSLSDQCGNASEYMATYTTIDTIAPVLVGVPGNLNLSCDEPVPDPPVVTVTDNCTPDLVPTYLPSSSQVFDGSCQEYEYNILRTWVVSDSCGNSAVATQFIRVTDEVPPSYNAPADITISCTTDPLDLTVTGNVSNVFDNCSADVDVQFTDQFTPGTCIDEATITRLWRATDVCGNVSGKVQVITIADLQSPSFNVPPDITVDCSQADDLNLTGIPTNVMDDCDPDPDVDFTDDIFPDTCPNNYLIRRKWIVTDRCGQFTEVTQEITVVDQQAPEFVEDPEDFLIFCAVDTEAELVFHEWILNNGNGTASDNCTLEEDITWVAYNSGTTDEPSLVLVDCPTGPDQIVQRQDIDFIIFDECGLSDTMTVSFTVLDQLAPTISGCPSDFVVGTNPGDCAGEATLVPPLIIDECSLNMDTIILSASAPLTSQAAPGQEGEVVVDAVDLDLVIPNTLPINVDGVADLAISLFTADAESPEEFFRVYGEDGTLLGQTSNTATQCGDGVTLFPLTIGQLNNWSADGIISIRLEPNIPMGQPERFAINANCPGGSTVQADLSFIINELRGISYQYSIDGGSRITVAPIAPVDVMLDQGEHLIRYFAIDCAGNIDSCEYSITVEDMQMPEISCPMPITVTVDADSCQKTLTLPVPLGAVDNCDVYAVYERTLPATQGEAFLQFFLDPNLNDYLPQGRTLSFDDVAANVFSDVTLTIDLQGDFNSNGAFVTILGDDGSTLATTSIGIANCTTPGQLSVTIPAATFNSWAADGLVNLEIVPNDITVPPGVLGDGINPCNPMIVTMDGDRDSISYITATLRYDELLSTYYATGVTPMPQSAFPSPSGEITATFNVGTTEMFYLIQDQAGNADTCSFSVNVQDVTPPTVLCQPTNLFINPSGLQVEDVSAIDVDAGSFDNCGVIDSLWLSPNVFDCSQVGQVINVTLSARDTSGNIGTCQTIVGIAPDGPMPTANSGLCGGDTLFLVANPPAPNPGVYTYQWFGPTGMSLSPAGPNPDLMLTGIDGSDEGPYRVVITGLTGCTAEGVVNVSIEDLPLTPELQIVSSLCSDEDILLETPMVPSGMNVTFYWYEGIAPNGTLLGTSTEPMFTVSGPHSLGVRRFYMKVEANGCLSAASAGQQLTVFQRPTAVVTYADTLVCAQEVIALGVNPQSNATYSWSGPNGFTANVQFPNTPILTAGEAGYYFVEVNRGLCVSAPDSTLVTVKPRPAQPTIASNSPVCAGAPLVLQTSFTGASTYLWSRSGGFSTTTSTPSLTIPMASAMDQGTWSLVVTLNGCPSSASESISVVVNPTPVASASADPEPACQGDNVTLSGFSTVAGSSYEWSGPNNYSRSIQNPVINNITPSRAGTYEVTVTSGAGCVDSAMVEVNVLDNVNITGLSDNVPACVDVGFNMVITASTFPEDDGDFTYHWQVPGAPLPTITTVPFLERPNATSADDGVYVLEVFTAEGCSSGTESITIDLNFVPAQLTQPVTVSGETSFCEGESFTLITSAVPGSDVTYFWNTPSGNNIPTGSENMLVVPPVNVGDAGNYRVYVVREGCASSLSPPRNITINPIPNVTLTSNSPVCAGDVISLQSTFYPSGDYSWSGPSSFGTGVEAHNPVINNADSLTHDGVYRVVVEVAGCVSDTIITNVVVRNRPMTPIVSHDISICLDDPDAVLTLAIDSMSAVPGADYLWYTGDGGEIQIGGPSPDLVLEVTDFDLFANGGTFPFYARSEADGCRSALSNPTLVRFDTIPINTAFAGVDSTVCSGQFVLQGAMPTVGTGMWSLVSPMNPPGFVLANPDAANSVVSGLTTVSDPYTLRWTLSNGACRNYSFDEVTLNVINAEPANAGPDLLVCEDEIVILEGVPPGEDCTGIWVQDPAQIGLGVVIVDPTDPNTEILGLAPDNFYFFEWRIDCVCGMSVDVVAVNVSDPITKAGPDRIVCDDLNEVSLVGEEPTLGSTIRWYSPDSDLTFSNATSATPTVGGLKVGENILIMEVDQGYCGPSSRDTAIVLYKLPPVLMDDDVSVDFGGEADVLPLGNDMVPIGTTVSIISGPFSGEASLTNPELVHYVAPANFVGTDELIYAAVSEGCASTTATINFIIGNGVACKVPSIFTPNGDDYNDHFVIPCLLDKDAYPRSQVTIFNRWGDEVYRSGTPYDSAWDGTYSGEELPVDTYFYIVDLGDGSEPTAGYVMIQR